MDLESYPLHKAAFFNDVQSISHLIKAGELYPDFAFVL